MERADEGEDGQDGKTGHSSNHYHGYQEWMLLWETFISRRQTPLWQCISGHFDSFLEGYEERYRHSYGHLRTIIPKVVGKFMGCGEYSRGFARVRCDHCTTEYLLPFSCKGRWFCPSCHQKKVQLFGFLITETILSPIPHRHITIGIPKILHPCFRFHRGLIKELCRIANGCILDFQRTALNLPEGVGGPVITIHTFGEYLDFHPHLHALVADGLFTRSGMLHVMPKLSLAPMEELWRVMAPRRKDPIDPFPDHDSEPVFSCN